MKSKGRPGLSLTLLLAALGRGPDARAGEIPVDLTVGYRFLNVSGNEDMYRSQLNEQNGFLVRDLHLSGGDVGLAGVVDHFRLDAGDLGAGPAGSLRLEVGRTGFYSLRAAYSSFDRYSALPAFANPLLDQGVTPGQHTSDRKQTILDAELQLFPGGAVTPIVGYTRNRTDGPGTTTYHFGEDEFHLDQRLAETDQEFRVGASFQTGAVSGSVTQGWRQFRGKEEATLVAGAGAGNNGGPYMGQGVSATSLARSAETDVNTPVTNAFLSARLGPVRLSGTYVATRGKSDTTGTESAAGTFASADLERFFKGYSGTLESNADAKYWRGTFRADVHLAPGLDLSAGYRKQRRELEGVALFDDLYLSTFTFTGFSQADIETLLTTRGTMVRVDETLDAVASVKFLGPFAFRASYQRVKQDMTLTEDVEEVVLAGGQGGEAARKIDRLEAGLTFSKGGFTLGAEARGEKADEPILRTDFIDRTMVRFRAAIAPLEWFRVIGTLDRTWSTNDRPGIGFEATTRNWAVDAEATIGVLRLKAGGGQFRTDTSIPIRQPQDFSEIVSVYAENGKTLGGGATVTLSPVVLDAFYSHFQNTGSWPLTTDRFRMRAEVEVAKALALVGEFDHDAYREKDRSYGALSDYQADRYGIYVRWKP